MNAETGKVYGVSNLRPIIMLGVEMGNVADEMGRTKGMARYLNLSNLFDELVALGKVDFAQVKLEITDLDDAERAQLENEIKVKFDIKDDSLEGLIEDAVSIVEDSVAVVVRSIELVKKVKNLKAS